MLPRLYAPLKLAYKTQSTFELPGRTQKEEKGKRQKIRAERYGSTTVGRTIVSVVLLLSTVKDAAGETGEAGRRGNSGRRGMRGMVQIYYIRPPEPPNNPDKNPLKRDKILILSGTASLSLAAGKFSSNPLSCTASLLPACQYIRLPTLTPSPPSPPVSC